MWNYAGRKLPAATLQPFPSGGKTLQNCAAPILTGWDIKKEGECEKGKEVDIKAYPILDMERLIGEADVALLGPQVGYQLSKAKEICGGKGVPVDVIPMADYGMCNGMNVLKFAFQLASGK